MKFTYVKPGILQGPYKQLWYKKDIVTKLLNRRSSIYFNLENFDEPEYNKLSLTPRAVEKMAKKIATEHSNERKVAIRQISNNEINFLGHKKPSGKPPLYISSRLYYLLEEHYQNKRSTTSFEHFLASIQTYSLPHSETDDWINKDISNYRKYLSSLLKKVRLETEVHSLYNKYIINQTRFILDNVMNSVNFAISTLKDKNSTKTIPLRLLQQAQITYNAQMEFLDNLPNEFQKGKFNLEWFTKAHPDDTKNYLEFQKEIDEWNKYQEQQLKD